VKSWLGKGKQVAGTCGSRDLSDGLLPGGIIIINRRQSFVIFIAQK